MAVPASAVGRSIGESEIVVTPRMTMAYAAALGAHEEVYLDDLRPEGVVAPPPFCVVLEWPLVSGPAFRQVTRTTDSEGWGSIHVTQDSEFHQPIRPGRRYVSRGRVTQVRPTRVGAYVAARLETLDGDSAEPIVTTWFATIVLGVGVEGEACALEPAPELGRRGVPGPVPQDSAPIRIARELPHVYSECAGIWNPIHTERAVARSKGLPDIMLHGTATWALAGLTVIRRWAAGDPTRLKRLGGHFAGRVSPGRTIRVESRLDDTEPGLVRLAVRNSEGELAIECGRAELAGTE